ncbi:MAG: ChbG/HpnK family deacetylase, partial [Planctomycetaceae bacterium]|nr:ChbG/HpnK family deacetylase [Planctomycetaceae bacterium]
MLMINADDFGMSTSINQAIVRCFREQLITSTTIMANMPAFEDACRLAHAEQLSDRIGVHLNLTEGRPLLAEVASCTELCQADGQFRRFRSSHLSRTARKLVAAELHMQIQSCRAQHLPLGHADSHQHVHNEPALVNTFCRVIREAGIPTLRCARNSDPGRPTLRRIYKHLLNAYLS